MTLPGSRVLDYLQHMLEAITRIHRYTSGMTETDFLANELVQDGVIRNLEVIGEAARNIGTHDPAFAANHPELPLKDIYLMRNRLTHGYFSIDMVIVWTTVQRDLLDLETQASHLYRMLKQQNTPSA
jgi:uncharacterized protein with HEPN domain